MAQTATNSAGAGSTAVLILLVLGLLVVIGVGVKMYDLKRKREMEGVALQARLSDALMREPDLISLAVTPTAHVPWWSGTPVRLEISGRVPTARIARAGDPPRGPRGAADSSGRDAGRSAPGGRRGEPRGLRRHS